MNEFFGHHDLWEKWKLSFSNLVHSGSHWGMSAPSPMLGRSAWHIYMQYMVAGLSSKEETELRERDTSLDSPRGPSPSIYDYDYNWRVCGSQAFRAHSHAFSLLI